MKAVVKTKAGKGNIELRDMPTPTAAEGQVLIRVEAAGICGSDLHLWDDEIQIPIAPPVIIGHEFSGVVEEVSSGIEGFKEGDKVTSETAASVCENCLHCRTGNYNLCHNRLGIGFWINGAFARYCVVPAKRLHKLPDNVDMISAALCEPLAICVHAVNELTGISAGDLVVVTGPGPIGLLSMQCAKAEGATLIVCGTSSDEARLELAKNLGADIIVNVQKEDVGQLVADMTEGCGADVVLECSGVATAARSGLEWVRKGGKFTQIGLFGKPIEIDFEKIAYKEIIVKGSFSQKWTAWKRGLNLLGQGKISLKPIVSDVLPLDRWQEGFEKHRNKSGLKIVLKPE